MINEEKNEKSTYGRALEEWRHDPRPEFEKGWLAFFHGPYTVALNREYTEVKQLEIAKKALEQWKCSYCRGNKTVDYRAGKWAHWETVPCPECNGSGLHKVAQQALKEIEEKGK
jgi:hypothetical protein